MVDRPFSRHQRAEPGNILKFVDIPYMFLVTAPSWDDNHYKPVLRFLSIH